ncbi:hypothetical protein [Acinetobacter radioresistens]|uniref:hypothetical protein n=1 Tax=Acinetobacter radioresistens TaxID=40216 RepID=UPI003B286666
MWQVALGAVVLGGAVLALLDRETRDQHERFQRKERQLRLETAEQRARIQKAMQRSAAYLEYKQYIEMHYNSVQTANQAFELYTSAKNVINQLYTQLKFSSEQIQQLKHQRNQLQRVEREVVHQQLQSQYLIHKELKQSIQDYKVQKDNYYLEIKKLNEETAQLKQYIRLNTGKMGQEWYARLEQRRLTSS